MELYLVKDGLLAVAAAINNLAEAQARLAKVEEGRYSMGR